MNPDARGRLEQLLDRELEVARSLELTLAAEKSALTGESAAAVERLAAEKVRLFDLLESMEKERRALGHAPAADAPPAAGLADRWRALMDLMAGCRAANEVNGHIIHARLNQIRQLLGVVRGVQPLTYGPQGKTLATALRALARA